MADRLVPIDENYRFPTPLELRLEAEFAGLVGGKVPLAQIPAGALVTDATVAQQVNGTQTGAAIDQRIATQVTPVVEQITADYIASDQTIVDAAAAAVNANPKIASIEAKNVTQDAAILDAKWYKGDVPVGLDLGVHYEVGTRQARTSAIVQSMVGLPSDATIQPMSVKVELISSTNGVYLQTLEQYSAAGPVQWERLSLSGNYSPFRRVDKGWHKGLVTSGTNLGSFFEVGLRSADTSTLVGSLGGRPEGSSTHPLDIAVRELSEINGIYLQTITQWAESGPITWERISLSKVYGAFSRTTPDPSWVYGADAYFFGDSLVEQGFPNYLTGLAGDVVNRGRSGDTSNDVLVRAGIIKVYALPVGGSIPASGVVALDVLGRQLATRDDRTFTVWWEGIAGTLRHTTGEQWTFTRHVAGNAVPITAPKPFVSAQAIPSGVVAGFFFGTNDIWHLGAAPETDVAEHIVANYHRAVEAVPATPERRALVFGSITTRSTVADDPLHQLVKHVNGQLRSSMPHRLVSLQEYMSTQAMSDLGLTPTALESDAMAACLIPESLYVDNLHLTQDAQEAFAVNVVKPTYRARGWA